MLSKINRADRKTVEKIFKEGRFNNSPNLSLKFILDKTTLSTHISFLVPKTVSKKAVVRNLLRRRGYSIIKKHFNTFPSGFSGVFIFGKKSMQVFAGRKNKKYNPILNLESEIKSILSKI